MPMTTLSFHVNEALNEQLSNLAEATDRSKSYIIRKAVEHFLSNHKLPNAKTRKVIDDARGGKGLTKVDDLADFLDTL